MAIKVNNVTVIDDSRNLTNLGSVSLNNTTGSSQQVFVSTGSSTAYASGAVLYQNINAGYVGIQTYTSPGTFTVGTDCPSSIKYILIAGCGGGGNGGSGAPGLPSSPGLTLRGGNGGGGGAGSSLFFFIREVSNGNVITMTIGGAAGNSTVSIPGPTTIATFLAGNSGTNGTTSPGPGGDNTVGPTAGGVSQVTLPYSLGDVFGIGAPSGSNGGAWFEINESPDAVGDAYGGAGGSGGDGSSRYFKNDLLGSGGSGGVGGRPAPAITSTVGANATGNGSGGGGGGGGGTGPGATAVSLGRAGGTGAPGAVIFVW